jgi:hypothetical protein
MCQRWREGTGLASAPDFKILMLQDAGRKTGWDKNAS